MNRRDGAPALKSLLPSNIADWVVLVCRRASAFVDSPITLREWPGSAVFFLRSTASQDRRAFRLVPVSTIYRVVVYISGNSADAATYIISAQHMSQILASLGGRRLKRHEWPDPWTVCHLGCDPSHQVWLRENRRTTICSCTRRLANRTGTISQTWQAANLTLVRWC